jgi:hypothetical protein
MAISTEGYSLRTGCRRPYLYTHFNMTRHRANHTSGVDGGRHFAYTSRAAVIAVRFTWEILNSGKGRWK